MKFTNLLEATSYFSYPQNCNDYLISHRWKNGITCVFCKSDKIYTLKGVHKRYKCSECKKHFSLIKGTIFENSQIPLQKWFIAFYILSAHKKGISSTQLARNIGVTQKTAWFMEQRIRYALRAKTLNQPIDGLHQTDETYIGGKARKGSGIKGTQGRSLKTKTPVFGILHVGGDVYLKVVADTKARTLVPIISQIAKAGSIIVSDEWLAYTRLHEKYNHITIRHYDGEYARGGFHTNSIENFWSHLKRGINGTYHKVSPKHLHRYCEEFAFRYNSRKIPDHIRFELAFGNVNCRLTLKELTGKNKIVTN